MEQEENNVQNFLTKFYKKPRLLILDLILLNLALISSFILRLDGNWLNFFRYYYLIIISIVGLGVLYKSNLYNKIWHYASIKDLEDIVKQVIIINLVFAIIVYLFRLNLPRSILILNIILEFVFLATIRYLFRIKILSEKEECNNNKDKILIVGAGDAAEMLIREMKKHPELDKEIIGLIDDNRYKLNLEIHGYKVLGNRHDIPEIVKGYNVNEVLIAIPSGKGEDIKDIYNLSKIEGVKVETVPGLYEIINGKINLNQIREVRIEDLLGRDPVDLNIEEISAYLENRSVLVTGGGGSIGSELCRQIAHFNPENIIILDIYENNLYFLELELKDKYPDLNIIPVIGSIRDKNKLQHVFASYKPDVVFHAAAHKHVPLMEHNPEEAVKNNVFGTKKLAEIADEYNVNRFVLISTDKAVNPTNVMGATKRIAEMIIENFNKTSSTNFIAVRFGNVLGSKGSVIPLFKKQIADGGPVTVTHQDVMRYFMTIPEAAQLVIQAGSLGKGGEVFVLDMGEPIKILDLAKDLIDLSGLKIGKDIDIEITGLRPGEKLFEELLNKDETNIATEHERIFITKLKSVNHVKLNESLKKLEKMIYLGEKKAIIRVLEKLVDTYKPCNNKQSENIKKITTTHEEEYIAY